MKNLILIENAKELFDFASRTRQEGDTTPCLPSAATLVIVHNMSHVELQNADNFILSEDVNIIEILTEAIRRGGLKADIT